MITTLAIQAMYPNAIYGKDFLVQDRGEGAVISLWNLPQPKPTEAELQAAWKNVEVQPKTLSNEERIKELENVVNMLLLGGI